MKKMETVVPIGNFEKEVKVADTTNTLMEVTQGVHANAAILSKMSQQLAKLDKKKVMHGIKVGFALAVVSLLFAIEPLYEQVGDNAMWAIMTVVVVFEFSAGATVSKGLNRGMGTIAGGGLGCLAAISTREIGHISTKAICIGISIFVVGSVATYTRLVPSIKLKYDYGVMIFILTFNLVAFSGFRADEIIRLGCDRLMTIIIGFALCILISLFLFPIWAGDELHHSISKKFQILASAIEECLDYIGSDGETRAATNPLNQCTSVLYSKASDENLANFARWEPPHGKFGFSYPWDNYLKIGDSLRELAACIYTLKGICVHSHGSRQKSLLLSRMDVKESCASLGDLLSFTLVELGHNFSNMKRCDHSKKSTIARLTYLSGEVNWTITSFWSSKLQSQNELIEIGVTMSFVFGLLNVASKIEALIKEVENLEILAGFGSE